MTYPDMPRDEVECSECCGNGQTIGPNSGEDIICPHCNGQGWRPETLEECEARSEASYDRQFEGEPPVSAKECYEAAWKQKQELRR